MVKREGMITFTGSLKKEILEMFEITTDKIGFLILKDTEDYIKKDGNPIHIDDFAGIMRDEKTGGMKIITSDIASMIELNDKLKGD